jgi:hypothetical protein
MPTTSRSPGLFHIRPGLHPRSGCAGQHGHDTDNFPTDKADAITGAVLLGHTGSSLHGRGTLLPGADISGGLRLDAERADA